MWLDKQCIYDETVQSTNMRLSKPDLTYSVGKEQEFSLGMLHRSDLFPEVSRDGYITLKTNVLGFKDNANTYQFQEKQKGRHSINPDFCK